MPALFIVLLAKYSAALRMNPAFPGAAVVGVAWVAGAGGCGVIDFFCAACCA
jgi:hypothetical protein